MIFDTNILIDALNGHPDAEELLKEAEEGSISIVTWIEVMAGARPDDVASIRTFLGRSGLYRWVRRSRSGRLWCVGRCG